MGGPRERVRARDGRRTSISATIEPLNTIALEVVAAPDAPVLGLAPGLDDEPVRA